MTGVPSGLATWRPFGTHCRPVGALLVGGGLSQGLTPLANDWRPFGTHKWRPFGTTEMASLRDCHWVPLGLDLNANYLAND